MVSDSTVVRLDSIRAEKTSATSALALFSAMVRSAPLPMPAMNFCGGNLASGVWTQSGAAWGSAALVALDGVFEVRRAASSGEATMMTGAQAICPPARAAVRRKLEK